MTLRVLLVDDEKPARDRLRRLLREYPDIECVGEAADGESALLQLEALTPDLAFLDVQMPELDGLSVAAAIPPDGACVVFVTAFDDHAVRAFELAAVDYLLKPVEKDRLRAALERVRTRHISAAKSAKAALERLPNKSTKMAVRSGAAYVVFDTCRIVGIVADDHYASILVDGRELLHDDSLDKLMGRLDAGRFIRVHRSAIVNIDHVCELIQEGDRKYLAVLDDPKKTRVPVSRERLDDLKARLGAE